MHPVLRITLCSGILLVGVAAQAGLESMSKIERPTLRRPLNSLPTVLGDWVGRDEPIDPKILEESQSTECISRSYTNPRFPGVPLSLWINYSIKGDNMRHSPEVCLPSSGYKKEESRTQVLEIGEPGGEPTRVSQLCYTQGDVVTKVGFWYYIYGEEGLERWIRQLPITSRSSHGRTTRGSGLTVEVFWSGEDDPDNRVLQDFASSLIRELDPIMPVKRAEYHVP